jgi:hypothetical protein
MSGSDSRRILGGSSFGQARLPVAVVHPASSAFRLRPTWVRVSPCVGSIAVCHASCRFESRLRPGTRRVSQVPDASLHACHALTWTPADPRGPHQVGPSVLASDPLTSSPSASNANDGAVSSFGDRGLSCGLRASLSTLQLTCSAFTSAVAVATLGRSGWLTLTPQGLAPCKKRQALLGALTDHD